MFDPVFLVPKDVKKPSMEQFLSYYKDFDIPKGAFINYLGVLEVPSPDSGFHFTQYISPLRNRDSIKDMEEYPIDNYVDGDYPGVTYSASLPNWRANAVPEVFVGGTGFYFDKAPNLPYEIEHHMPDYHLYDKWVYDNVLLALGA